MKTLNFEQMEQIDGGIDGCGWMAIGLLASPAGWVFVGGVAAAGFTTAGGIATGFAASFVVAGVGCAF
jgi:hypothetical protein